MSRTRRYVPTPNARALREIRSNQVPSRRRQDVARSLAEAEAEALEELAELEAGIFDDDEAWLDDDWPPGEADRDDPLESLLPVPGHDRPPEVAAPGRRTEGRNAQFKRILVSREHFNDRRQLFYRSASDRTRHAA